MSHPASSLLHLPTKPRWEFDEKVAGCFDDMLSRSIPLYDEVPWLVSRLINRHLDKRHTGRLLDLGCGTLTTAERLLPLLPENTHLHGVDVSEPMLEEAYTKAGTREGNRVLGVCRAPVDLTEPSSIDDALNPRGGPVDSFDCILLLWTLQFMPIETRAGLLAWCRKRLKPGGCLIVAEKLRGQKAAFEDAMADTYADWKVEAAKYPREQVEAKRRALQHALASMDAPGLKQMIAVEGFAVEEVLRYLQFGVWYCLPR